MAELGTYAEQLVAAMNRFRNHTYTSEDGQGECNDMGVLLEHTLIQRLGMSQ